MQLLERRDSPAARSSIRDPLGGVSSGEDAIAMMMAGANAVQVGTATFADPRAPWRVVKGLARWARDHDVAKVVDLIGVAHE